MKKLVISALLLGALQATGCIFVSDDDTGDDDGPADGLPRVEVSWDLVEGETNAPSACPAGATTAAIYAHRDGDSEPFEDLFDCVDGAGETADLPLGTYTLWVELQDDSGAQLFARSESVNVTIDSESEIATANFEMNVDHGFFDVSYEFTAGNGCATAGQTGVSVLSTISGTTDGFDDIFVCTDGLAPNFTTTAPIPAFEDYVVSVALINAQGEALASSEEIQDTIDHGHDFEWLGDVDGEPIPLTP